MQRINGVFSPFLRRAVNVSRQAVLGWLPCTLWEVGLIFPMRVASSPSSPKGLNSPQLHWSCFLAALSFTNVFQHRGPEVSHCSCLVGLVEVSTPCRAPCCTCTPARPCCHSNLCLPLSSLLLSAGEVSALSKGFSNVSIST